MDTLAPAPTCCHSRFRVETRRPTEFIDITDRIDAIVSGSGMRDGLVNVQTLHTTTAIVVNEHEPLLLADFAALLERIAPVEAPYQHDDMAARTVNVAPGTAMRTAGRCSWDRRRC
jgi:secondary thiamine-phosphate synthase enzyme